MGSSRLEDSAGDISTNHMSALVVVSITIAGKQNGMQRLTAWSAKRSAAANQMSAPLC